MFPFCVFLSQLSELVWKLAKEISLQSASKRFPSFGPPANSYKSNAKKSRFRPNWNSTETIYHWSVIPRSFSVVSNSAKHDANGFFKVFLLSSHLLILQHPDQTSKFGACAVTGYCSFNLTGRSVHTYLEEDELSLNNLLLSGIFWQIFDVICEYFIILFVDPTVTWSVAGVFSPFFLFVIWGPHFVSC